ncbi:uncharacterized protein LOC115627620 isoform X2 [Scaptodrosophila lebanonensis]|uniref:Uncharacterized protein LOC115627620 isoform X2 n=1 Tax=Drosophila lebanonensis TaxID=7225 RepID=A0A6J2TVN1_DROLE|nr:uncharacterized protein LOC115627620 isoform X2 [Scaptodrosophila lebanonensis]
MILFAANCSWWLYSHREGDPINCTMVEEIMRFSSLKMAAETTTVNENSSEVKVALKLLAQMVLMKPCRLIGTKRKNSYNVFDGCSSSKSARVTDPVPKFVGRFDGAALAGSLNIQDFKAGGSTGPISSRLKYKLNKPPAWRPQLQFSSNQKDITEGREWLRACEAQGNHFQLNVQRSLCPSNMNGPPHGSVSYFHHAQEFALSGTPELFRFVARQASGPEAKVTELPSELSKPQND